MVKVTQDDFIGSGLHRNVYHHPDNNNYCIKIVVNGDDSETKREQSYYNHLRERNINWDMLPQFVGNIDTNMGAGAVFELVKDYDGEISKTFEYYLNSETLMKQYSDSLRQAVADLHTYLLENRIITMTLKPKNIMFKKLSESKGRLVIIDNIGNSDLIPLANYLPSVASKKIQRKWQRFIESLQNDFAFSA